MTRAVRAGQSEEEEQEEEWKTRTRLRLTSARQARRTGEHQ